MNRKIFIYVGLAVLLVLFAFGSLYTPKTDVSRTVEKVGTTVSEEQFSKDLAVNEMGLHLPDYIIVVVYAVVIVALGLFASRTKKGHEKECLSNHYAIVVRHRSIFPIFHQRRIARRGNPLTYRFRECIALQTGQQRPYHREQHG